ncbi:MAG: dihydrolipoamide acetyltransferase family protein [Myxococcota bacterium]
MATEVVMPQMGESIAEGTLVKWLKAKGDAVKKDETLLLISTDKVEAEVPAPQDGVLLDVAVPEGETVPVGAVLAHVGSLRDFAAKGSGGSEHSEKNQPMDKQASADAKKSEDSSCHPERGEGSPRPSKHGDSRPLRGFAPKGSAGVYPRENGGGNDKEGRSARRDDNRFLSPLVRRIASEHGITEQQLATLPGTGQGGRVTKKDLLAYLQGDVSGRRDAINRVSTVEGDQNPHHVSLDPIGAEGLRPTKGDAVPLSGMRRAIMEHMVLSRRTSAHVTTFFEVDYSAVEGVRGKVKEQFRAQEGVPLTVTAFIAAACSRVLRRHPYLNASLQDDAVVFKRDVHLGVAVAIEEPEPGLVVPVVRHADRVSVRGMAQAIADLARKARTRRLSPNELQAGTFTISNPGALGGVTVTPIINQPQVAILGVGGIQRRPVVVNTGGTEAIGIRSMGMLSLSFDHRLVDGVTADRFMADLKNVLETWSALP